MSLKYMFQSGDSFSSEFNVIIEIHHMNSDPSYEVDKETEPLLWIDLCLTAMY